MTNRKRLFEQQLPLTNHLVRRVFNLPLDASLNHKSYAHIIFYDNANPKVIAAELIEASEETNSKMNFENLLFDGMDFRSCLVLSTLYFCQPEIKINQLLYDQLNCWNQSIEFILKPTNGFLIYAFQFEQLVQLILGASASDAVEIRKAFNKHESYLERLEYPPSSRNELRKILRKHLITDKVRIPNYSGAVNLMTYARLVGY